MMLLQIDSSYMQPIQSNPIYFIEHRLPTGSKFAISGSHTWCVRLPDVVAVGERWAAEAAGYVCVCMRQVARTVSRRSR